MDRRVFNLRCVGETAHMPLSQTADLLVAINDLTQDAPPLVATMSAKQLRAWAVFVGAVDALAAAMEADAKPLFDVLNVNVAPDAGGRPYDTSGMSVVAHYLG